MKNQNDIFLNNLPSIDLHGFDRESATLAVKDFIHENNISIVCSEHCDPCYIR